MKSDRELLEAAAKAAGIDGWWSGNDLCFGFNGNKNVPVPWRPLTDDGDALRLAVKLEIDTFTGTGYRMCETDLGVTSEPIGTDPMAATRRAIVRAAAAMAG